MDKEGLSLFIALRWMQRPERVMVGLTENIQACLRDFQTGTASMARKRHLASSARGLFGLCLMASQDTLPHIALCCLEGSTLSNLVHRRRRCARIVLQSILCLAGSTPEDGSGASTRRRISLWLQGSLFFTAKGSYFVLWLSVCQRQTRRVGRFRQASLLAWINITA